MNIALKFDTYLIRITIQVEAMLKKISKITNFGVWDNFNGNSIPEFNDFNLIYGWNYSGKTTLSRVFRCLEEKNLHKDYPNAKFSLSDDHGHIADQNFTHPSCIRVFNEDFRNQHLRWDDNDGFTPIFLLGAENIARQDELKKIDEECANLASERSVAASEISRLEQIISKAETECASQIAKELPGNGRFNKSNLRPIVTAWNGCLPTSLSAHAIQAAHTSISSEQKDVLHKVPIVIGPISTVWQNCLGLLETQITSSVTIPHLSENPQIAAWVEQGRNLHTDKSHCEFCEGKLSEARQKSLADHFSIAFEKLKSEIGNAILKLRSHLINFSSSAYPKVAFYADLHEARSHACSELDQAIADFNEAVTTMINALEKKRENPFGVTHLQPIAPDTARLTTAVSTFGKLLDKNNKRTDQFTSARNDAISLLKHHYALEAMKKIDRFSLEKEIDKQRNIVIEAEKSLEEKAIRITEIKSELSKAVKGAEAVNYTLIRFFGKADIQISVTDDDRFLLMRGQEVAKNLSEGERTAVAFCYFVTKLLENGNDLSKTIVYIDDPISSLDSNHLLHVNSFIKETFYNFDKNANPKHSCLAKQLFISTHNYEFFHLTWDWMNKMKKIFSSAYFIERTDSNGRNSSRLIECPESIIKYKSEYLFLYHQLANFIDSPSNDLQVIFNIGNMARRFTEGYLAFKYLEHAAIDSTLPQLIVDPVQCERARKFMHFHSHTLNRAGGMKISEQGEAVTIVSLILDAVRNADPVHYRSLEGTR